MTQPALATALARCHDALLAANAPARADLRRAIACLNQAGAEWPEINARTHYLTEAHRHVRLSQMHPGGGETAAAGIRLVSVAPGQVFGKRIVRVAA